MAEKPISMPDIDSVRWNTGPSAETKTEPTSGKKNTGYAFEDVPPYDEWNWEMYNYYQMLLHLQGIGIREFTELDEAIAACDENEIFRIRRPDDGGGSVTRASRFSREIISGQAGAGSGAVVDIVTDGKYLYYAQGANVYAMDPQTGGTIWSYTTGAGNVTRLAVDGVSNLYVARNVATNNLQRVSTSSGTVLQSITVAGTNIVDVAANEWFVAVVATTNVYIYVATDLTTILGSYNFGGNLYAVCVDEYYAYIGGVRTGGYDVRQVDYNGSALTPTTLPIAATDVRALATDGEHIYVGTVARAAVTPQTEQDVNGSIFTIDRFGGRTVHYFDAGTLGTSGRLCVDDHYLYGARLTNSGIFNKRTGAVQRSIVRLIYDCDLVSMIGIDPSTPADIYRIDLDHNTRLGIKVGNDCRKRPFHQLAIPLGRML